LPDRFRASAALARKTTGAMLVLADGVRRRHRFHKIVAEDPMVIEPREWSRMGR
jgi:hypothetical protein